MVFFGRYRNGIKAVSSKFNYDVKVISCKRGTQHNVALGISINQCGGYFYWLCKFPKTSQKNLFEIRWKKSMGTVWYRPENRSRISANWTDKGTLYKT